MSGAPPVGDPCSDSAWRGERAFAPPWAMKASSSSVETISSTAFVSLDAIDENELFGTSDETRAARVARALSGS